MAETWQEKVGREFDVAFAPIEQAIENCARVIYDAGAREEREAVVAAVKRRRAFLAEFFEPGEVRLRDDELDELLRVVQAGEHRKEAPSA